MELNANNVQPCHELQEHKCKNIVKPLLELGRSKGYRGEPGIVSYQGLQGSKGYRGEPGKPGIVSNSGIRESTEDMCRASSCTLYYTNIKYCYRCVETNSKLGYFYYFGPKLLIKVDLPDYKIKSYNAVCNNGHAFIYYNWLTCYYIVTGNIREFFNTYCNYVSRRLINMKNNIND